MLVEVVQHDHVDGAVGQRQLEAVGLDEPGPAGEPGAGAAQPGGVEVDAGHRGAGGGELAAAEPGGAADVEHPQPGQRPGPGTVAAEEVRDDGDERAGLAAAGELVERPRLCLGVGKRAAARLGAPAPR